MNHLVLENAEKIVDKLWGKEFWLTNQEYCAKILSLDPGYQCSLHFHRQKKETFLCLEGVVQLEVRSPEDLVYLHPGTKYTIEQGRAHRFQAFGGPALILEISTHHEDSDTVRITESQVV